MCIRDRIVAVNISVLENFDNDAVVSVDTLIERGIVKNPRDGVKILGNGELTKKLTAVSYTHLKKKRRGMVVGKTAKTKKAIVKLTEDSKDIEIFAGL